MRISLNLEKKITFDGCDHIHYRHRRSVNFWSRSGPFKDQTRCLDSTSGALSQQFGVLLRLCYPTHTRYTRHAEARASVRVFTR